MLLWIMLSTMPSSITTTNQLRYSLDELDRFYLAMNLQEILSSIETFFSSVQHTSVLVMTILGLSAPSGLQVHAIIEL